MAAKDKPLVVDRMSVLFQDPSFADLQFICGDHTFHVHKAIVCSASPVLARECSGGFKEANSGIIKHTQFDKETAGRMFSWIYTNDYTLGTVDSSKSEHPNPEGPEANSISHIRVYAMADYYELPLLKKLACDKFSALLDGVPVKSMANITREVYECTTAAGDQLRKGLYPALMKRIDQLTDDDEFVSALINEHRLKGLAALLCRQTVLKNIKQSADYRDLRAKFKTQEDAHNQLLREHSNLKSRFEKSKKKVDQYDKTADEDRLMRQLYSESYEELSDTTRNINKYVNATRWIKKCRGCGHCFGARVEHQGQGVFTIRCRACHHGHDRQGE